MTSLEQSEIKVSLKDLIAPSFYDLHHEIKANLYHEYWLKGGRGSTKSTFTSIQIVYGMLRDQDANAVVCRRYHNELRDTVYGQFLWTVNKMELDHLWKPQIAPMQLIYTPTGQRIVFKGADNPRKMKSINLGRGYIKYAWFEEVDQFAGMDEIRNITQSLFRGEESAGKKRISFYSYNPPKSGRSWVNQEVRIPRLGRRVHHSDYRDVPRHWLGERFLADAEHLRQTNETAYRHEYLGEEVGTGLEVFTNVTLETLGQNGWDQIRQGLDFGYAAHPACFERMNLDRTRLRLHFLDEISGINLFNRELHSRVKLRGYESELTIADSAEPKSIDELRDYGMHIKGAKKGPGSVEYGIKFLQDLEQIIIDPQCCPRAAKEFINYALETDRSGEVKSRFPDKDNHSIDSSRYGCEDDMITTEMEIW